MRFGLYYSGGLDSTFNDRPIGSISEMLDAVPRGDYPAYAEAQVRELIARYRPSVLWNDIAWPTEGKQLWPLFEHYYAQVPDGVVNDRWMPWSPLLGAVRSEYARRAIDKVFQTQAKRDSGVIPPLPPHCDVRTPEYVVFDDVQRKPWECVRGMDQSFGHNRCSRPEHFLARDELLWMLTDIVAKGGNLLLNVGPRGVDAQIPDEQLTRLDWLGNWVQPNTDAIVATRPWVTPGTDDCGRLPAALHRARPRRLRVRAGRERHRSRCPKCARHRRPRSRPSTVHPSRGTTRRRASSSTSPRNMPAPTRASSRCTRSTRGGACEDDGVVPSAAMPVEIWSDVVYPRCYIGKRRFEKAVALRRWPPPLRGATRRGGRRSRRPMGRPSRGRDAWSSSMPTTSAMRLTSVSSAKSETRCRWATDAIMQSIKPRGVTPSCRHAR